jgi:hypothetical protein
MGTHPFVEPRIRHMKNGLMHSRYARLVPDECNLMIAMAYVNSKKGTI